MSIIKKFSWKLKIFKYRIEIEIKLNLNILEKKCWNKIRNQRSLIYWKWRLRIQQRLDPKQKELSFKKKLIIIK